MSPARQITTTSVTGLRALGTSGQRSYELIVRTMMQRFGPAHAALFAEPIIPDEGDQTDWYTGFEGQLQPLKSLAEGDKIIAEERLSGLMDEIRELAASLRASQSPDEQRLGEAVENALSFPGVDSVWVVKTGDTDQPFQPILTDWATQVDTRGGVTDRPLIGWAPRHPTPPSGTSAAAGIAGQGATGVPDKMGPVHSYNADEASRRSAGLLLFSLLWLVLALLTGVVLYLLLPACGLNGVARFSSCPAEIAGNDATYDQDRQLGVLKNRIAFLERNIAEADRACVLLPPPVAAPLPDLEPVSEPVPEVQPDHDIEERLEREAANDGEATITLVWYSLADIDLRVTCPAGDTIFFGNTTSPQCSGRFDIDMNASASRMSPEPIEHVYFTELQSGEYRIEVVLFNASKFPQSINFRVRVTFTDDVQEFTGTVSAASPRWTTSYTYAP